MTLSTIALMSLYIMPSMAYTVQPGDTLSKIAQQNNTTVSELARVNNIADPDLIYVGQNINVAGLPLLQPTTVAPTDWPVINKKGVITQLWNATHYGQGHTGLDIADNSSPLLVSIYSGTVISTGWENGGGGNVVRVKFDNGLIGLYNHTQGNYKVIPGQRVSKGQGLASMGMSGTATGIHVHFEISDGSSFLNPLNYVRK